MYKNQLQELAQRSCFNLPSYTCLREGPDHAPRFKSTVNFNGETFESPQYFSTLRQAEHAAAEVALHSLSHRGPSHSLAARILDETGVYKNLLQEIAQRVGSPLPQYSTYRSGLGHQPIFTGMVELAGIIFTGEPAKNKKQAEKNAAMAAWTSLKQLAQQDATSSSEAENSDELEQIKIARALLNYRLKEKMGLPNSSIAPIPFEKKFQIQKPRPSSPQPRTVTTSKILPLICQKTTPRNRPTSTTANDILSQFRPSSPSPEGRVVRPQRFPAAGAAPYVPIRHCRTPYQGIAPPVTVRSVVPVFSAPPLPPPCHGVAPPVTVRTAVPVFSAPPPPVRPSQVAPPQPVRIAPPVCIRQAVPVFAAPPVLKEEPPPVVLPGPPSLTQVAEAMNKSGDDHLQGPEAVKLLERLKI
ncbi:double-stranded RNA-binding protein 2-like [Actinidia eriantha]|uniref:double-stranded RNA-binding protein 2-like n=1 Tax=Actinidia eriantha TaxID=165200 RepID=UPI00258C0895|nr:double-stranded RNA-binding protein 2-like [Actinidia eriantha]